jgi:UPF0755 protein
MLLRIIKSLLLFTAVGFLFFSAWFSFEFYTPHKEQSGTLFLNVEKGESAATISQNLKDKGIIKRRWAFLVGYKICFPSQSLKAGEYAFMLPASLKEILSILVEGRVRLHPITIPEGLTRSEIAQHLQDFHIVDAEYFLQASEDPSPIMTLDSEADSLEGYLFPETYHFPKGIHAEEIVSSMLFQFRGVFNEEWKRRAEEIGMTIREIVILASLIEKETSLPEERELVSAVFHNRLKKGMKLDCDPTIIYALKQDGMFQGRLRTKDLKFDSPFNTYLNPGLPPGPIANPGRETLRAALYPATEDYLFFVSKNDGSHQFSRTFREHQNAVNTYQRR